MTDKEMIEEMARVLHDRIVDKTWRAKKVAEELYKIAIPEGSVVLSKEEYEDLRILEEKYGKPTYIDGSMTAYAHRLETANNLVNKSRKETAREILNAMLDIKPDFSLLDGCTPSEFMRSVDLATNIIFQAVKKQAERYDVEVKE